MASPFTNEPLMDFRNAENARAMRAAIDKVRLELGREYDLVIGGKRSRTAEKIRSLNPANPSQVIGVHQKAGQEHVEPAMQAALDRVRKYLRPECWRDWKGPEYGSEGGQTIRWAHDHVAEWLKKLSPEVALIMFGSTARLITGAALI